MDELTKFRITGAIIWLALLILLVPSWYSDPVIYEQPHSFEQPKLDKISVSPVQTPKIEQPTTTPPPKEQPKHNAVIKLDEPKKVEPKTDLPPKPQPVLVEDTKPLEAAKPVKEPTTTKASAEQPKPIDNLNQEAWLVRVASFNSIEAANKLLSTLEVRYQVTIGDFSNANRKVYSVRVGPYYSFSDALQAKQALDEELSTDAVVVKIR